MPGRLLIVDDDVEILDVIALYLRSLGHDVRIAHSVGEALPLIRFPFDIAIVDWSLPDGRGLELLSAIATLQAGCAIVVTTGHSDQALGTASMPFTVRGVLRKPFTMRALALRIEALLVKDR